MANCSNKQRLIFLNVGGRRFKMEHSTVCRYPDSLLGKMVQEFTELVDYGDEIYVDRNPEIFHWIIEIYRDGDYQRHMPTLPASLLQKELDYYQLPSLDDLGIAEWKSSISSRDTYAERLMHLILQEIDASGLHDFFPWTVLVYHKLDERGLDPQLRVYVSPPVAVSNAKYILERGHNDFDMALQMESDSCPRLSIGERSKLSPYNQTTSFLIYKRGYTFIGLLGNEVEKRGMVLEEAKSATFYLSNGKMVYGHFILGYNI